MSIKKTLIAISGKPKQGKTETIRKIYDVILNEFPNAQVNDLVNRTDITAIITIGRITIGIESQGDPPGERLARSLILFASIPCDIIICAARTSGYIKDLVENFQPMYDIIWATNYRSDHKNRDVLNQLSAEQIFELIHEVIKGRI